MAIRARREIPRPDPNNMTFLASPVISLFALAIPMVIFYEGAIAVGKALQH